MKVKQTLFIPFKKLGELPKCLAALLPMMFLLAFTEAAQAQITNFFWNPQGLVGPSDGNGNWDDTTVSNWLSGGSLGTWPAASANGGSPWATTFDGYHAIIGAGVLGSYNITNIGSVTATAVTFSNAGFYTISGAQLSIDRTAGPIPVLFSLSNTTNTINTGANVLRLNQGNDITNAPNSSLTLASGATFFGGNPRFEGVDQTSSTVNLTGGIVTDSTSSSTMQASGVTLNITNATFNGTARVDLGRNAVQSVAQAAVTVNVQNGGQFNANTAGGNNSGNHLQISRAAPATLNVYPGGLISTYIWAVFTNPNTSPSGNLRIVPDSGSQGTLNVLGGTVLVGIGANQYGNAGSYAPQLLNITFFDAAPTATATTRAILNMTGGSITANGILMTTPASVSTAPTNGISITGGTLYLGAQNISYPAGGMGANFFLNLSGGTVSAIQNWSPACSAPINLTNVGGNITFQTADINGTAYNMAFSGPLTGIGGFTQTGGGTLTLSGANNYTGATVVNNGTLVVSTVNSPQSGPVTLNGALENSVIIASKGQSWTANGDYTYASGSPAAEFNYLNNNPSTTAAAIQVNGNLIFSVTPSVTVDGGAIPRGTYPLIKYTGTLSGTPPSTITITQPSTTGYISNDVTHKTIELVVTGSLIPSSTAWRIGSGLWGTNLPTLLNWNANGTAVSYADGDAVTFDDTASGPFPITVTVTNTVKPQNISIAATNSFTIQGPGVIAGSGPLNKSGTGTLTLSGTNTYSGGTIVAANGGTLNINYGGNGVNNSAIGTGPLTLNTGATLGNSSGSQITLLTPITQTWNDSWNFAGANNLNLGIGPVTLGVAQVVLNVTTNTLEVDGQITDGGHNYGIQKQGAGSLTLSNANNTFSGGLDIEVGTVNFKGAGAAGTGSLTLAATIDNTSGSPLTLAGLSSMLVKSFTFLGSADLDLGAVGATVQSGTITVSNGTLTFEGDLNGASTGVTKSGPGALTIAGSGISGSVGYTINQGTLNLDRDSGNASLGAGQPVTVNTNGALVILNPTGTQFNQASLNSLTLNGGLLEWNGDSEALFSLTFNSGIIRDSNPITTAQMTVTNTSLALGVGVDQFDITNGATLTINGPVAGTDTNAVLLKTGAGALILTTNNYVGNTTVSNGVLSLAYPNLSASSTVTIAGSGVLDLNFTNTVNTTNIVAALIVNGVSQPSGFYNKNSTAYITSGGTLNVVNSSGGPALTSVTPNPVAGSSFPVALNLSGSGFVSGCTVLLTNLTTASSVANTVTFNSSSSLSVSAALGTLPSSWNATVVNPGPAASGQVGFSVTMPGQVQISKTAVGSAGHNNLVVNGTGGTPGYTYEVVSSTNVALPVTGWTPVYTNVFDGSGNANYTNAVNPATPKLFLRIVQ